MSPVQPALTFSLPVTSAAHRQAEHVSQQYLPYYEKVEESYLNCLALYVVQYYLRVHDYPVQGYSSQPFGYIEQTLSDGMTLQISGYGAIACLPLSAGTPDMNIPVCIQDAPIAYVAVEFNDELSSSSVLGFLPQTDQAVVSIDNLQPLADLSQHLAQFNSLQATMIQLNQWWQRSFTQGWEYISELTAPNGTHLNPAWGIRSTVRETPAETVPVEQSPPVDGLMCQKPLQLGASNFTLVLTMERFATDPSINFEVRLSPSVGQPYLPENVQLIALDEADNVFSAMRSREHSPTLALRFRADPGDRFKLNIVFNDVTLTEIFEL